MEILNSSGWQKRVVSSEMTRLWAIIDIIYLMK